MQLLLHIANSNAIYQLNTSPVLVIPAAPVTKGGSRGLLTLNSWGKPERYGSNLIISSVQNKKENPSHHSTK